jgi:hypothetical protein
MAKRCSADVRHCGCPGRLAAWIVKALIGILRIEYRLLVSFRRESPVRGRRLRINEALFERLLMSPVGYQFLLHLAPRIDKMLISRTRAV